MPSIKNRLLLICTKTRKRQKLDRCSREEASNKHGKNGFFVCLSGSVGRGTTETDLEMTFSSTIARTTTTPTVIYILVFSSLFSFPVGKFTRAERRRSHRPANGMFLEEKMCLSRSCGRGKSEVPPTDAKIAKLLNRILWDRLFFLPFNTFF